MKYWMFQNNQVKGPYDPDDLSQVPGFSAESLVCSEGRKGTNMGDWQRASMVPELSVALLKASQFALSGKGATGGFYPGLPPEPTLKDLAQLGSLQEKVSLLDNTVSQLQENLRLKETDILSLHRELEEKNRQAQELAVKLGGVEERLSTVNSLQTSLDKTAAAEHDLEATITRQSQIIVDLTQQLQSLQADSADLKAKEAGYADLKTQLEELKSRAATTPEPASFDAKPGPAPFDSPEGLHPAAGESLTPLAEPKPEEKPIPVFDDTPAAFSAPAPAPAPTSAPIPATASAADPIPFGGATPGSAAAFQPGPIPFSPLSSPPPASFEAPPPVTAAPTPVPTPSIMTAAPTLPPKKGGSAKLVLAAAALLALAGAYAAKKGLLPMGRKKPAVDLTPLPPPPAPSPVEVKPAGPSPEEIAEQQKKDAVELVRGWPVPGGPQTLGQLLEGDAAASEGLSPWMAEKIKDDLFQVNFYAKADRRYEFQADMAAHKVLAHNEPAAALLTPASKKLKKARSPRKAGRKTPLRARKEEPAAQEQGVLEDLLKVPSDDGEAPPEKPAKKVKRNPRSVTKELDDLMGEESKAPAQKPDAGSKDESLDQLLVPGGADNGELAEPQASPEPPANTPPPAKSGKKSAKKPADAELLDDLLKP